MLKAALITLFFEPFSMLKSIYYLYFGRPLEGGKTDRAILLIHGNYHNDTAWIPLRKKLREEGLGPIYTVNLPSGMITKKDMEIIKEKLDEIPEATIDVVGHSRGGDIAFRLASLPRIGRIIRLGPTYYEVGDGIYDIDATREKINVKTQYGFLVKTGHLGLLYHPVVHKKIMAILGRSDTVRVYARAQDRSSLQNR